MRERVSQLLPLGLTILANHTVGVWENAAQTQISSLPPRPRLLLLLGASPSYWPSLGVCLVWRRRLRLDDLGLSLFSSRD